MRWRLLLAVLFCAVLAAPAPAQSFFSKKKNNPKPNPAEQVAQLITTLKTDQDESKRETAAAELRQFDPKTYPEIIPVLVESLQNDPRPTVRMEAAQSLGRMPMSQQAGWALEQAAAKDSSLRVRTQARTSLLLLKVKGYRSDGKPPEEPTPPPQGQQPPKSSFPSLPSFPSSLIPPFLKPTKPAATPGETPPPPLAPQPQPASEAPKPAPAKPKDQGPDLLPPDR